MTESDWQKFFRFRIDPRDSILTTGKEIVNLDNGSLGGSQWTCFYIKDEADSTSHAGSAKISFYFDSFYEPPNKVLHKQLPKAFTYLIWKTQDKNSNLCETYCLYFFYLKRRMSY